MTAFVLVFREHRSTRFPMLSARLLSECDTFVFAMPCYSLFRLVSIARYVFKALSIGSPGSKIKVFRENNACFESIL